MNDAFKDHFSAVSTDYASFRPGYPSRLVEELAGLCGATELALDCGCGTGQLSVLLAERFSRVIAIDGSRRQIESAQPCEGVEYRVATAEESGLPAASADLVAVAQAAHWLDLDRFYAEVRRVLRPAGVIALITYGVLEIDDPACDREVQDFYGNTLDTYWPPERRHVEAGYATLPFPFREAALPRLEMRERWNCAQLLGYIGTWSALRALEQSPESGQIARFQARLSAAWGNPEIAREIRWPLAVRAGLLRRHHIDMKPRHYSAPYRGSGICPYVQE